MLVSGIIAEVKLIKPGVSHYCHRKRSDQNQDQAAGGVELSSRAQQPESEEPIYCNIDSSKHNIKKKDTEEAIYCNTDTSKQNKKKKVKPAETDTVNSAVKLTTDKNILTLFPFQQSLSLTHSGNKKYRTSFALCGIFYSE
ncbi:high affinity immunoglobulin gamma Fc receptor I-like [Huso huso]